MGISSCVLDALDCYRHPSDIVREAARVVVFGSPLSDVYGKRPDFITTIDKSSWGSRFEGIPIIDHKEAILTCRDALFVINHLEARSIATHLQKFSINHYIDITHIHWRDARMMDYELVRANTDKIARLYDLLSDAPSRDILDGLLLFRLTLDPSILKFSSYEQYLHPNTAFGDHERIIDGGAFNGDSASRFFAATNNTSLVFSFEPEAENLKELHKNTIPYRNDHRSVIIPKGLWSSSGQLSFSRASQSSRITDQGTHTIETTSIDAFCHENNFVPTTIKLDVEGAEMEVLQGAKQCIAACTPKMMISVYHCGDHLWEIPHAVMALNSRYTFYLGHHSPNLTIYETVLYALKG